MSRILPIPENRPHFDSPDDANGLCHGGLMCLVAEQIAFPEDARRVVFYEFVGHFGLNGFLWDAIHPALDLIHINNPLVQQYTRGWMKNVAVSNKIRADGNWRAGQSRFHEQLLSGVRAPLIPVNQFPFLLPEARTGPTIADAGIKVALIHFYQILWQSAQSFAVQQAEPSSKRLEESNY
jgi:hypothetical protein